MAQQVVIAGAVFNDVPYIQCPDANNVLHSFYDTTIASNAAAAADIAQGKLAYVNGSLVTGTASGGGGGLEYETGTWEPSSDVQYTTIDFANAHTEQPMLVIMADDSPNTVPNNSFGVCATVNYSAFSGAFSGHYGISRREYKNASGAWAPSNYTISSSATLDSYVTNEHFSPNAATTGYYWRTSRTYKWIAVWAPTS